MMNRSIMARHNGKRLSVFNNSDHHGHAHILGKGVGSVLLQTNGSGGASAYQDAPSAYLRRGDKEEKNVVMGNGLKERIKEVKENPLKENRFEKLKKLNLKNKNITF
jgi:hypothetical protein